MRCIKCEKGPAVKDGKVCATCVIKMIEKPIIKVNEAELLDIVAGFQEGFNTNLHCRELVKCIADNIYDVVELEY